VNGLILSTGEDCRYKVCMGKIQHVRGKFCSDGKFKGDTMTGQQLRHYANDFIADVIGSLFCILFIYFTDINVFCDFVSVFATNDVTVMLMVSIICKEIDVSYVCRRQCMNCELTQ